METLPDLQGVTLDEKVERLQKFYEKVAFHESGIMYSMQKIDQGAVRPFTSVDFEDRVWLDTSKWRIKPAGQWELTNNENSITTSGLYLVSQCYRYEATGDGAALAEAARAATTKLKPRIICASMTTH